VLMNLKKEKRKKIIYTHFKIKKKACRNRLMINFLYRYY